MADHVPDSPENFYVKARLCLPTQLRSLPCLRPEARGARVVCVMCGVLRVVSSGLGSVRVGLERISGLFGGMCMAHGIAIIAIFEARSDKLAKLQGGTTESPVTGDGCLWSI